MTLTEFLLSRIAEYEWLAQRVANSAAAYESAGYEVAFEWHVFARAEGSKVWERSANERGGPDPRRVLAECEAKRRIVEECRRTPGDGGEIDGWGELADLVLKTIALPYADHPDYRPQWRP